MDSIVIGRRCGGDAILLDYFVRFSYPAERTEV